MGGTTQPGREIYGAHRLCSGEQPIRPRGFLLGMPERPPEHIQRRLDRLRAQRAEQLAKERQKTACTHDSGTELLALVARNGAMHVYTGCRNCHANLENGRFHPAKNIDITVLPVGTDLRLDNPPCQVCGSFGTEVHHWAPAAVFGTESALWPTTLLCPDCHSEWHRRMEEYYAARSPQLFRRQA